MVLIKLVYCSLRYESYPIILIQNSTTIPTFTYMLITLTSYLHSGPSKSIDTHLRITPLALSILKNNLSPNKLRSPNVTGRKILQNSPNKNLTLNWNPKHSLALSLNSQNTKTVNPIFPKINDSRAVNQSEENTKKSRIYRKHVECLCSGEKVAQKRIWKDIEVNWPPRSSAHQETSNRTQDPRIHLEN